MVDSIKRKELKKENKRGQMDYALCLRYQHGYRYWLITVLLLSIYFTVSGAIAIVKAEFLKQIGHTSSVNSVSFSPDGKWLASGSEDKTVKIWDSRSGKLVLTLSGHSDSVSSVSFSPDGKWLASGSWDETVKIWDSRSGKLVLTLSGHSDSVLSVSFSPDGKWLASGSEDETVKIWNSQSGKLILTLSGHTDSVSSVSFSPDGRRLASGSWDKSLKIWDSYSGNLIRTIGEQSFSDNNVESISFSPDGRQLASSSQGWRLVIWDSYSGKQIRGFSWKTNFLSVSFSPYGNRLAAGGMDKEIKIWDIHSGNLTAILTGHSDSVSSVSFSPDGKWLASGSEDKTVKIWDSRSGKLVLTLSGSSPDNNGRKGPVVDVTNRYEEDPEKLGGYLKKSAIIIGISDYKNLPATSQKPGDLVDLKYAHQDANAFRNFIRTSELSGGDWDIRYFVNEEATEKNIDNAITGILSNALSQDLIYIFFSGHGRGHPLREKDVYLLTWDFEPDYYRSGYSYKDLLDLIADSKAKHIIAFIDACRSGTIGFGGKGKSKGNFDQDAFGEALKLIPENRVVFSSGRGTQLSYEDPDLQRSVFTYYLLKGLNGEAEEYQNSQFVDLGELAAYVQNKVYEHTKNSDQMSPQIPRLWEASGVTYDDFPVAVRPRK